MAAHTATAQSATRRCENRKNPPLIWGSNRPPRLLSRTRAAIQTGRQGRLPLLLTHSITRRARMERVLRNDIIKKSPRLSARALRQQEALGAGTALNEFDPFHHSEDERRRRQDSRLQARRRDHGRLGTAVRHREPRSRIDDMAVTFTIDHEPTNVVAGGGDTFAHNGDAAGRRPSV